VSSLQQIFQAVNTENLWQSTEEYKRNEYLKVAGSTDLNIYYVEAGSIRIFVYSESEEHTIRFAYAGDFVVALDSYFLQRPSKLYLQTLRQARVKIIHKSVFEEWVYRDVEHLKLWNEVLQAVVVDQLEREQDLLISSPHERYQRVLARSPRLFQEVPHKYIANYLRMTAETLSRVKKE
jgi:CRP-like cAMP-binding protein